MSRLIRANHPKGWDAKRLAYVQEALDTAAERPGAPHTTSRAVWRARFSKECRAREAPPTAVYSSLERLGLDPDEAYTIAAAADGQDSVPLMRQQLLTALALLDPVAPSRR